MPAERSKPSPVTTFNTRETVYSDFSRVSAILTQAGMLRRELTEQEFRRALDKRGALCFVAVVDGEVVGTIFGYHDTKKGYASDIAVDHKYRRRGIGTALLEVVRGKLDGLGIKTLEIRSMVHNIDFFASL